MNLEELRIGNYIHTTDTNQNVPVSGISAFTNQVWVNLNPFAPSDANNVEPIPLTEDLLLICGFNTDYKSGYIGIDVNDSDFVLSYPGRMGKFQKYFAFEFNTGRLCRFIEIPYLHNLQNLFFSHTGKELEVNHERLY